MESQSSSVNRWVCSSPSRNDHANNARKSGDVCGHWTWNRVGAAREAADVDDRTGTFGERRGGIGPRCDLQVGRSDGRQARRRPCGVTGRCHAIAGGNPRFPQQTPPAADLGGRWAVDFSSGEEPAVGLFEQSLSQ